MIFISDVPGWDKQRKKKMKKMIMFLAVATIAGISQAASIKWSASNIEVVAKPLFRAIREPSHTA